MSGEIEKVSAPTGNGGIVKTEGFGTTSVERSGEVGASALQASAQASVQAPYVMAMQRPRDWDVVRQKLLRECVRPSFAHVGIYAKPVGGKPIEGLSVRFAEAAMRCMGNLQEQTTTVFDDESKCIIRIVVTDLESNIHYTEEAVIEKTMERSKLAEGQKPISARTNSYGKTVYLVPATQDDIINKKNSATSKSLRNNILRILPGDIKEECRDAIYRTRSDAEAKDPDAAKRALLDAFAKLGVTPDRIKAYFGGRELHELAPQEKQFLVSLLTAIKDGETTWDEVASSTKDERAELAAKSLKERVASRAKKAEAPAEPAEPKPAPREPGED